MQELGLLTPGSRVRIEVLQGRPEMNGRTGVICGALQQAKACCARVDIDAGVWNEASGRWPVEVDADAVNGAAVPCTIGVRAVNLVERWVSGGRMSICNATTQAHEQNDPNYALLAASAYRATHAQQRNEMEERSAIRIVPLPYLPQSHIKKSFNKCTACTDSEAEVSVWERGWALLSVRTMYIHRVHSNRMLFLKLWAPLSRHLRTEIQRQKLRQSRIILQQWIVSQV